MARTITQRIALDGGKEIKSQLEQIGAAAVAAFDKLAGVGAANTALGRLGTSIDGISKRVADLQQQASNVKGAFGDLGSAGGTFLRNITLVGAAVGGAVAAFGALAKSAGDANENLQNMADTLGTTPEKLDELRKAASLAGVGDLTDKALTKMAKAMGDAGKSQEDYSKKMRNLSRDFGRGKIDMERYTESIRELQRSQADTDNVFKKLGVSIRDSSGNLRDPVDAFRSVSSALKAMPDGLEKTNAMMELFGTKSARFGAFANQGAAGIAKMTLEAQRLAPTLDKEGRAALDRFGDSLDRLKQSSNSTKEALLAVFANDAARVVEAFTERVAGARAGWIALAKDLQAKVKPIIDDVVALLEGRDADVQNSFVIKARDAIVQFGEDVKNAIKNVIVPAIMGLLSVLQLVADGINKVFGTNLTGGQIAIAAVVMKITGLFGVFAAAIKVVITSIGLLSSAFASLAASAPVLLRLVITLAGSFASMPVLIAAVGAAVGFLVVTIVQKLGGISGILQTVQNGFAALSTFISNTVAGIGAFFSNAYNFILTSTGQFVQSVIDWFARLPATIGTIFMAIAALAQAAWAAIIASVADLVGQVVEAFAGFTQAIVDFFIGLPAALGEALAAIVATFSGWWDGLKAMASAAVDSVVQAFRSGLDTIRSYVDALLAFAKSIFDAIVSGAKAAADAIKSAASGGSTGGAGNGAKGFASGGYIRGPGTATSDSILARLSNGEFVQPVRAVAKYGVAFMEALRAGRISANRVRDLMAGVDFSGIADRAASSLMPGVPRFAAGGLAAVPSVAGASQQPVNLHIGGEQFAMAAPVDVVERLKRASAKQQMNRAGRKPAWYR